MDTPLKNQTTLSPLASKIQESPVSNYISNLAPIEPVKSIRNDHTFNSLTLKGRGLSRNKLEKAGPANAVIVGSQNA